MPLYFPRVLFGSVGAVCFALALLEWKGRPALAKASLALCGFSLLCVATDYASARTSIRVDLLLTIPAVSLGAIIVGVLALPRGQLPARTLGAFLALGGGVSLAWFSYSSYRTAVKGARIMARYDEGNRLYWNETIRCADNFAKRFGPSEGRDDPCLGNLVVTSRSAGAYPFTRVVINDRGQTYLLFSPRDRVEVPVGLRADPLAQMTHAASGAWSGDGDSGFGATHIVLTPQATGRCEAKIAHYGKTSILSLQRKELAPCQAVENPPITFLGPWGEIAAGPSGSSRLLQIWLWSENSTQGRGVLVSDLAPSGLRRSFIFLRPFRARLIDRNRWSVRTEETDGAQTASLTITFDGSSAHVTGPANMLGPDEAASLERKEVVTDPRIELVPTRDRALFERYLDDALFNLDLSWTAP